jgi:hypothetical protein
MYCKGLVQGDKMYIKIFKNNMTFFLNKSSRVEIRLMFIFLLEYLKIKLNVVARSWDI